MSSFNPVIISTDSIENQDMIPPDIDGPGTGLDALMRKPVNLLERLQDTLPLAPVNDWRTTELYKDGQPLQLQATKGKHSILKPLQKPVHVDSGKLEMKV